jgi:Golgi phosphoprotein 3
MRFLRNLGLRHVHANAVLNFTRFLQTIKRTLNGLPSPNGLCYRRGMPDFPPLTILEEFLLLAFDDAASEFWPMARSAFDCATAGAALMDLSRLSRVDCDLRNLFVVSAAPTGDDILDPVLRALALEPVLASRSIIDELRFLSDEGEALRERALHRLVERGILKREERKFLWVFSARRYPMLHDKEVREVKLRILGVVLGDDIPEPQDVMLVSLAEACGLFGHILSAHELAHAAPRIAQVARMDIIGRAVGHAVAEVEAAIAMASGI